MKFSIVMLLMCCLFSARVQGTSNTFKDSLIEELFALNYAEEQLQINTQ